MTIWVDAQMSPGIAAWIESRLAVEVVPVRDLGLGVAKDIHIFLAAREADAIVLTIPAGTSRSFCIPRVVAFHAGRCRAKRGSHGDTEAQR